MKLLADALSELALSLPGEPTALRDAWTYTIYGFDSSPYITRTCLPRLGNHRPIIHTIHRADADPHMHNHPWKTASFLILSGGYTEERLVDGVVQTRVLRTGDVNELLAGTYHRVTAVEPDTKTFGLVGDRVQDWGFLVAGEHVPHASYFARKNHTIAIGGLS